MTAPHHAVRPSSMRRSQPVVHDFTFRLGATVRRNLIMGSIALLVVIRFFTEGIHVLPGLTKLVDIPVLLTLLFAVLLPPRVATADGDATRGRFFIPGMLFFGVCTISTLLNLDRVS